MSTELFAIAEKVYAGERLSFEEAMTLYRSPNLPFLGHLASVVRFRRKPERIVTFIISRNINYTNVCWVQCKFCAFYRLPQDEEAYVLSDEEIFQKIEELDAVGGREILIQGGLNPKLRIDYFERLFQAIKGRWPHINIHGLSVAEVLYIAKISKLSVEETLIRLREAGMGSLPGAGGEILVDEVREVIAPYKDRTDEWLEVMRTAHRLGMRTTATMMYGHVERPEHRIETLLRIRELQDETGGFTAFAAWNFQPEGTRLPIRRKASGFDYLKTIALSRLVLDNVDNIQASWVTQGPKIAQISLDYGVNDFGQTMMEENVVSAAGTRYELGIRDICRLIRDAGYTPRLRTTFYEDAGDPEELLRQLSEKRRSLLNAAPAGERVIS
ncbi:MAG: cyclic dehypoxanthine futalosine synthase [Candidatus Poribacteria bacterium]|nr:MAG: cyclic dehypoxanthine futalosine synthase [Candidatus Poribacteria bacterium]